MKFENIKKELSIIIQYPVSLKMPSMQHQDLTAQILSTKSRWYNGRFHRHAGYGQGTISLETIMIFLNAYLMNKPEIMVPYAEKKFDQAGKLTDEFTRKMVKNSWRLW